MRTSSLKTNRLAVLLGAVAALYASFTAVGNRVETLLLDVGSRFIPEAGEASSVAVVAIDQPTLDEYGPWPWPRDRLAAAIDRINQFSPRATGLMLPLDKAETPDGLTPLREELDTLEPPLRKQAGAWLEQLDPDSRLERALRRSPNMVLLAPYSATDTAAVTSQSLERFALRTVNDNLPWHQRALRYLMYAPTATAPDVKPPLPLFVGDAASIGVGVLSEQSQRVHGVALAVDSGGRYLPGFETAVLAASLGLDSTELSVQPGKRLLVGEQRTIRSPDLSYYPRPAPAVAVYSLKEIMRSKPYARRLHDKTILLGLTAAGTAPELTGPAGRRYSPVSWSAQVVASLLNGTAIDKPLWFHGAQRALLLVFALYLLVLPAAWRSLLATGLIAAVSFNLGLLTLIVEGLWLPVVGPTVFLLTVQLWLSISDRRQRLLISAQQDAVEARLALGGNLQSQGQLDLAMDQFIRCLPASAAFEPLYELGLEFERRRQVTKALTIYEHLETIARGYRDSSARRTQLAALSDRFPNANNASAGATLVIDAPVIELPVLGRYRLERELGRGAMGTVYLAVDPTIGREVAIKTLPLLEEYEGPEQEAVAERFFQEAEAVGRLDHPNIVTIYDAGKEHDLAYMAMDYVAGESLDAWTDQSVLLPVWEVLEIAAQVADALDYAHSRKVIHRDIKPSNIIYDREGGVAKITDFGVARMLDSNRTRSGTVLGTPSYMSPEQVAGKKTDGRSDLFSLGTTLYQLLTGSLPFSGDSVAALMYQITNQKTPAMRKTRRGLPVCVNRLVMRALQKEPAKRFASGEAMAVAIRKCRAQFRGGRRKTA